MKRVLVALLAVIFAVSTTAVVFANCGSCGHGDKDKGCQKADPNSK
jgi:hypothetical protein